MAKARPNWKKLLSAGEEALASRNFEEAMAFFQQALKLAPEQAEIYKGIGRVYGDQGHIDEADEAFRIAIEKDPLYWMPYNNLGTTHTTRKLYQQAIDYFKKAIALSPNSELPYLGLGKVYLNTGQLEESEKYTQLGLEIAEDSHKYLTKLGEQYYSAGYPEIGKRYFLQAIALGHKSPNTMGRLGDCYKASKDYKQAIRHYRAAIALDATCWQAFYQIANYYLDQNREQLAIKYYEKAYQLADSRGKIFVGRPLCGVLLFLNRTRKFNTYLEEFLSHAFPSKSNDYIDYLIELMMLTNYAYRLGHKTIAQQVSGKIIELAPEYQDLLSAQENTGSSGQELFQKIANHTVYKTVEFHTHLAELYEHHKHWSKAFQLYRQVHKLDPNKVEPYIGMVNCCIKLERPTHAYWYMNQGLKKHPTDDRLYWKKIAFLHRRNDSERLIAYGKDLLAIIHAPHHASLCIGLCLHYIETGKIPELTEYIHLLMHYLEQEMGEDKEALVSDLQTLINNLTDRNLDELATLCLQKMIELCPQHFYAYFKLGYMKNRQGNQDEAIDLYQKSIACPKPEWAVFVNLGLVYESRREHQLAINCFEQGLKLNPDKDYCWSGLAANYLMNGDAKQAKKHFKKGLKKLPHNFLIQYQYAYGLAKVDRDQEAADLIESIIEITPADYIVRVYESLENLYKTLGNEDKQAHYMALKEQHELANNSPIDI